jgi:hypothetical protein
MMAGIFDEVMDGIAAKEKQGGTPPAAPPATPPAAPPTMPPAQGQITPPAGETKPMNTYSDAFRDQYGERR